MSSLGRVVAQYAKDTTTIVRSPISWWRKLRLWTRLTSLAAGLRGSNILGYKVTHYGGATLNFLYQEIFARQCYLFEARTSQLFILDCGANIGMAVLYFKWLYPDSEVWAFEPEPANFAALEQNVARNHLTNVRLHNLALWGSDGQLDLMVPTPGSLVPSVNPARRGGTPVQVQCARLSSFIEREVDFLKIDVEGAELPILLDLVESGKLRLVHQMVIEYHHNIPGEPGGMSRILRLLEESGYRYQVSAWSFPLIGDEHFQDILIGAVRVPTRG